MELLLSNHDGWIHLNSRSVTKHKVKNTKKISTIPTEIKQFFKHDYYAFKLAQNLNLLTTDCLFPVTF